MIIRPPTTSRRRGKLKPRWAAALLLLAALPSASAGAEWRLLVEPHYMRPDIMIPIPGSKDTILTPAIINDGQVIYLKRETIEGEGLDLASLTRLAKASASADLANLKPVLARDEKGVAVFAVIQSDRPIVAATVLAPDFIEKFAPLLGPDLLVAIPNRYRVYVYPALASRFQDTADLVLSDYDVSAYPVSREVFRVTREGITAIGSFSDR